MTNHGISVYGKIRRNFSQQFHSSKKRDIFLNSYKIHSKKEKFDRKPTFGKVARNIHRQLRVLVLASLPKTIICPNPLSAPTKVFELQRPGNEIKTI